LREFEQLTSDHIFPKCWYPETTPATQEKWKVPACDGCNQKYSRIEADLLVRLGLCVDPQDARAAGIGERAVRALTPRYGKGSLDQFMRKKKRRKLMKEMRPTAEFPRSARLPGFRFAPGAEKLGMAVPVQMDKLKQMGEKLVRGLTYYHYDQYIEEDHVVAVWFPNESSGQWVIEMLNRVGKKHHREPGIEVIVGLASDDAQSGLFCIDVWGHFKMYASVLPRKKES
jgi:hypothetical protein